MTVFRCSSFIALAVLTLVASAEARNDAYSLSYADVVNDPAFKQLGTDVAFYFSNQTSPKVAQNLGDALSKKITKAGGSDPQWCQAAAIGALAELRDEAVKRSGNAVINIHSSYNGHLLDDQNKYECHCGGTGGHVGLEGTIVKLAKSWPAIEQGSRMKKRILILFLTNLIVLPACRAPHESSPETAPASVGSATTPAPAEQPGASSSANSGQPLFHSPGGGQMMPVADVLTKYQSELSGVAFYFGDQRHPRVAETIGEYVSNQKTNAFNKSDAEACQWVALSALEQFHRRAMEEGGNAVINIHSYYKRNDVSDPTRYECHVGFAVAGVALKGTVVKLAR